MGVVFGIRKVMADELVAELDTVIRLWADGDIIEKAIFDASKDDLFEFSETVARICRHHTRSETNNKNEQFSFTANSALSGGAHPCASPKCRLGRTQSLVTFAALYADEVYIQQPFEDIALRGPSAIREVDRHNLVAGLYIFKALRPLIEKGIVKYAIDVNPFCDHHHTTVAMPLLEKITARSDALKAEIGRILLESCSVTFNQTDRRPSFEVSGPEGVIEHGTVHFHAFRPMPKIFRRYQKKGLIYALSGGQWCA